MVKDEKITAGGECFLCGKRTADLHYKHFWLGEHSGTVTLCVCDECVDTLVIKALGEKFWEVIKDSQKIKDMIKELTSAPEDAPEEDGDA